jgi:phosphoesterase RecJ-like protein
VCSSDLDLSRCGEVATLACARKKVLNIDHHISNSRFADVNWVGPHYSSASEMVYWIFKEMHLGLDKEIAMLLYVGILTDTGSFHYSNTTSKTHKVAAELISYGLNVAQIYRKTYNNVPFRQMKLLGNILSTMRRDTSGRVVWLHLKNDFKEVENTAFDLSEYLLSLMRSVKGIEVAVLFREGFRKKDEVRVNLRSQGNVDVNKVARFFYGGGHRTASGCTVKGKGKEVMRRVLRTIREGMR